MRAEICNSKAGLSLVERFCFSVLLLLLGILLFTLPQPNLFTVQGLPIFSYFAFIPIFLLVRMVSWKTVWLCGLLYGVGSYCLFTYWLATFHPLGIFVISFMYGLYLMLAFPLVKAAASLFPKYGWLAQWIVWCGYEYVKTLGFSGFHYGVTAYSHWRWTPMIQCTDLGGVWGLNAFIIFASAWCTAVIVDAYRFIGSNKGIRCVGKALLQGIRQHLVSLGVWFLFLVGILVYGFVSPVDYSQDETATIALIQSNSDPWVGGLESYERDLDTLISLSDKALLEDPSIELVVWPETAFVPRITWHYEHRYEQAKFELIEKLLNYIDSCSVPFVIGNDHGVDGYLQDGTYGVVDYNASILFRPGQNVNPPEPEIYFKMKLVPFTEYFPAAKTFPKLYHMLLNGDTHMWEPGTEPVVFDVNGLKFGTPICFEDTFGFVGRRFVQNGANAFVNMSNDAWSSSLACQYQHLSMALFRSVENRVPTVRATSTGQTSIIDPNGKILDMVEPFQETYLIGTIPIRKDMDQTLYTRWGDYVGVIFLCLTGVSLILGIVLKLIKKTCSTN